MNEVFDEVKRKTYEPPMTNHDWLRSLDDVDLAILISKTTAKAAFDEEVITMFGALGWLRETHKEDAE